MKEILIINSKKIKKLKERFFRPFKEFSDDKELIEFYKKSFFESFFVKDSLYYSLLKEQKVENDEARFTKIRRKALGFSRRDIRR